MLCLEAHECPAERAGLQKERSREKERRERETDVLQAAMWTHRVRE